MRGAGRRAVRHPLPGRDTRPAGAQEPHRRPHVLFIAVDDLSHWVGYYGRNPQTITPNLNRLAARGVRFSRSYCAAPVCNPSRAALMSGPRPSTTGVYENGDDWRPAISEAHTLPTVFRKAGYGEIKRMFVADAARGHGIGRRLLAAIESEARNFGLSVLRLETGIRQPAAIGLYRSCGYREVAPFGDYGPDPLSVFMEKTLAI